MTLAEFRIAYKSALLAIFNAGDMAESIAATDHMVDLALDNSLMSLIVEAEWTKAKSINI